ncbi:ATP-binding protein [Kineococcus arenarius]|uniref:ATP-binding protein n=1 Tax=unclassified Kineococcus TaxID=2621656 RepID=UPI003D7C8EFF
MSLDPHLADEVHLTLAPGADAFAQARRFLSLYAQQSGVQEEVADDLVQAAAELMAVGGRVHRVLTVAVREHPDQLTVLVDLAGPVVVDVADDGVVLLNGLSRQWGWRRLPGCTRVWCDVPKQQSTC